MRDDDLTPEERELVVRLRALPPEGTEPDWNELEARIRDAVGPDVPVPWWRKLRWLAPVGALATTAAVAVLWLHHPGDVTRPDAVAAAPVAPVVDLAAPPTTLWIDGQVIDVGQVDDRVLDDLDDALATGAGDDDVTGVLPAADLHWVDSLDDSAADRAEHWLERKKS